MFQQNRIDVVFVGVLVLIFSVVFRFQNVWQPLFVLSHLLYQPTGF
jgi:hypothetical protein